MTSEEKELWYKFLKRLPFNVRRQHNICDYIVDFYIAEKKTVIEIDGAQHFSPEHRNNDVERDHKLSLWNITVLRYSNYDINKNFDGVVRDILKKLGLTFNDLKPSK